MELLISAQFLISVQFPISVQCTGIAGGACLAFWVIRFVWCTLITSELVSGVGCFEVEKINAQSLVDA